MNKEKFAHVISLSLLLNSYGRNRVGIGRFSPKSQGRKRLGRTPVDPSIRLEEFWKT